jgi:hypothetical protein
LVHLICMRCNHANDAGAKFCGECGAGLLRRFCPECHAVNDAASHFCQSCGLALPDAPPTPQPSGPVPFDVPSLTDVAFLEPGDPPAPALRAGAPFDGGALVQLPAHVPARVIDAPPIRNRDVAQSYRAPIGLAAVAAIAMAVAVWVWPRSENPVEAARSMPRSMAATGAVLPMAAGVPHPVAASEADVLLRATDEELSRANALSVAAPQPIARIKEAGNIGRRRPTTDAMQPAVGAAAAEESEPVVVRRVARPAVRPPATPPPECTPQADALGLCASAAKVVGR